MDLVDEQDVTGLQRSKQAGQVAGPGEHGARRDFQVHTHLRGNDVRQGRLTQAGRAMEQGMVQRFAAHACRFYINVKVGNDFFLSGEIFQFFRPDYSVQILIFVSICIVGIEISHTVFSYQYKYMYLFLFFWLSFLGC